MSFTYEVQQAKKDAHEFAMITGFDGKIRDLVIPGSIDGYIVEAVGNHSFSGRDDIETVSIPESVKILYGFAFHNCKNLKKITLFDSIQDYYDGVCRQCDNLEEVEITVNNSWFEVIRSFLADNDKTLRFLIHTGEKKAQDCENNGAFGNGNSGDKSGYLTSCLTFPEYVYDFNENTMARTIQFSIAGSGYAFRECVDRRRIDYRQYDSLFEKAVIDGGEIAQDISVYRILYPVELESRYRSVYEKYIRDNAEKILERYVKKCAYSCNNADDILLIRKLLEHRELLGEMAVNSAIELSVQFQDTVLTALLMSEGSAMAEKTVTEFAF